jgi:hypothetical protein
VALAPHLNAAVVTVATVTVVAGVRAIRRGDVTRHRRLTLTSFAPFPVVYLYRVTLEGPASFSGPTAVYRLVYLPVLAVHVPFAVASLGPVYCALALALALAVTRPVEALSETSTLAPAGSPRRCGSSPSFSALSSTRCCTSFPVTATRSVVRDLPDRIGVRSGRVADGRRRVGLAHRERLSTDEVAVEDGVLDEVPDEHVSAPTGDARCVKVGRGELRRQRVVQSPTGVERVEHLPVTRGLRPAALDDVRAVRPAVADRVDELTVVRERLAQRLLESFDLGTRQLPRLVADLEPDTVGGGRH